MRPIYKSLALAAMTLQVSLALNAATNDGENVKEIALEAELLDSLRVELIAPNVSGARDLIKSGECEIDGSNLSVTLNAAKWIKGATYRVQVIATFGTQTQVIYALDVTVPYYAALSNTTQEYEDTVTVVSTISDGDQSGADATVYSKDGDGNAHITTPLSIGSGVATGSGSIASGYASEGASIQAGGAGAMASGSAYGEGASIQATSAGAIASGYADGEGASIQANSTGAIASGSADGEGASIQATSAGAMASGNASEGASIQAGGTGAIASGNASEGASIQAGGAGAMASGNASEGASIQAGGTGAIASGYADGEGASIQATSDGAIASGSAYGEGASIQANSTGAIASGYASGEGASIQAGGTGAIASGYADGEGASILADGDGAIASGYADATNGNVIASGQASQAFGIGVQATQDGQMALGKCNVVDTNGDYALIVGNGTADDARSNAFAITWDGNLVLFNAGTPVVLTPAKLATLIA